MGERQYLNLIQKVLDEGIRQPNRTGIDAISTFGEQMKFDLRGWKLPLFTTKRVSFKNVLRELLFFVRGQTDAKILSAQGVKIWDANGSAEFLAAKGFNRPEGELGPVYGHQWRRWGQTYDEATNSYSGEYVDQLAEAIRKIKTTPNARDIIVSAWNPSAIPTMALPPCHCLFQFYVANGELSCHLYQRSADMGLGVPYNVASYAILTMMIAKVTGLEPGTLVHTLGNAHVYVNHVDALKTQLTRTPTESPTLKFTRDVTDIDDFLHTDFLVEGYEPQGAIFMKMAV